MIRQKKFLLASAIVIALTTTSQAMAQQRMFDVPTQPAVSAIPELARQAQVEIVAPADGLTGINTQAVAGEMDTREALRKLLEGTGLEIQSDEGGVILLRGKPAASAMQVAGSGIISGRVIDPTTGEYLRNAIVRITSATGIRTITSQDRGEFQLAGVPVGTVEVAVSYTGFGEERRIVQLDAGEREQVDFELRSTMAERHIEADATLDAVQVVAPREGDARAIMEQRASMNITNTLSADSFGDIGDGNPGEFLKYMPGVDFDVVADDAPRNISLRGLPAKYTGVTLNGVSLPGIDANSSSSRTFSFEQSALSGVDSVTIYKTTSADMDANAPAGTIDIRTKKAFDTNGRRISVQISGSTHNNLWDSANTGPMEGGYDKKFLPSAEATFSDVFLDGRLGIAAGVSSTTSLVEQEQITAGRNYVPTEASPFPYAVTSISAAHYDREYNRRLAQLGVDFKATDELILSLMASVSRGDIEPSKIVPGFTTNARSRGVVGDPSLDFTTQAAETSKTLDMDYTYTYKLGYTRNFIPSFEWSNEDFKLDGNLFSTHSESRYASGKKGQVADLLNAVTSTGNFSASRSDWMHQDWDIQQVSGPDWSDPDSYTLGSYAGALGDSTRPTVRTTSGSTAELDHRGGSLNFSFYQDIGDVMMTWKTGFKATKAEYEFGNNSSALEWTYDGPMTNAEFLRAVQSANDFSAGDAGMYVHTLGGGDLYIYSLSKIYEMMQANPEQWVNAPTPEKWYSAHVDNVRKVEENVRSLYFMGTADFSDKLKVQAGLRWEQTTDTSEDFDPLTPDQVVAAGYDVSASTGRATTIDGLQYQYFTNPRAEREVKHDAFFPSGSIKYSFVDGLDLIVGYSKTIQRPEIGDLAGVWSVDYGTEDGTVLTAPNTALQPEYSDNYSIRLVKYFEPVGLVAFNLYQNRISNLIDEFHMTPEEFGYDGNEPIDLVSTKANLDREINVKGYEFEFNHAMDYLPGALKGTVVRGSYTHADPDVPLSRVATQVANLGLAWQHGPVRLNLNTVWSDEKDRGLTGNIVNANGIKMNQKQPFDDYLEVNLSGRYTIIPKTSGNFMSLEAFFTANNLFNQNRHTVYSNGETGLSEKGHHSQIYITSGRRASIGIRARF